MAPGARNLVPGHCGDPAWPCTDNAATCPTQLPDTRAIDRGNRGISAALALIQRARLPKSNCYSATSPGVRGRSARARRLRRRPVVGCARASRRMWRLPTRFPRFPVDTMSWSPTAWKATSAPCPNSKRAATVTLLRTCGMVPPQLRAVSVEATQAACRAWECLLRGSSWCLPKFL